MTADQRKEAIARFIAPYVGHAERVVARCVEDAAHRMKHAPGEGRGRRDALVVARKRLDAIPEAILRSPGATAVVAWNRILGDSWRFHRAALGEYARPEPEITPRDVVWAIQAIRINGIHPLHGIEAEVAIQADRLRSTGDRARSIDAWESVAAERLKSMASRVLFTGAFRCDTLAAQLAVKDGAREPDPTMEVAGRG